MSVGARTWLLGALIAAALGAGAWWWLRPHEATVGREDAADDEGSAADADPAALAAHGAARASAAAPARLARGTVVGEVRRAGQPAAARITAYEVSRPDPGDASSRRPSSDVPPADGAAPAPCAETRAGPDGAFHLDLTAPGTYLLVATGEGRALDRVTVRTDGARVGVRLDLRGGGETLEGRALHADGRPFHGSIAVEPFGDAGPFSIVFGAVTTDDQGRFEAGGLEPGPCRVTAFVPGRWRAASRTVAIPHAGELTFVVDEGTRDVAGRVTDERDGRGVAGAVVTAMAEGPDRFDGRGVTDGEGRFTLRAPTMRASWTAGAAGFVPLRLWRAPPPEGTPFELRLVRLARLSGRVTSEGDDGPVAGVTVYAVPLDGSQDLATQAVTDADGRYAIPGACPGDLTVFAWGRGWGSPGLESARSGGYNPLAATLSPDATAVVDLKVRRAAQASGRVTDAGAAPVAGAQVVANLAAQDGGALRVLALLSQDRAVATDADGRFAVDTLLSGVSYRFEATAPSASPGRSPPMHADVARPLVVDLVLGAPRWADVDLVEKESGTPVAGGLVYAYQQTGNGHWTTIGPAAASVGGRARLGPLPPGELVLGASAEGYLPTDQPTVGGPDGSTADVQAKLTFVRTRLVEGVVRYADGQPASALCVRLKASDFEDTTPLGEDGRFREFCAALDATVEVEVLKEWGGEVLYATRATPGDPPLTLTLPGAKPPRLVVRVTDASGRPVAHAVAVLRAGSNDDGEVVADGRVEYATPSGAAHVLVCGARGAGGPLPLGLVIAGPVDPKATEFTVRMPAEQRIEGVVRAADGRPVRGVYLRARPKGLPAPFESWTEEVATARTDDAGRFRIGGLGAGTYEIRVDAADRGGRTDPVEATAGTTDLVITLGESLEVRVTVLGADGRPVSGATVRARARTPRARPTATETDLSGTAVLRGMDRTGLYRLDVVPDETRTDVLPLGRDGWMPRDEVLTLPAAYVLGGVVRDRAGAPAADGWVDALRDGDFVQRAPVGRDGAFRFQRLAAGAYRLVARAQSPARSSRPASAEAGARDVVLVLDAASELTLRLTGWTPVPDGAWTALWDEETGGTTDWTPISDDGTVRFGDLHPEGRYRVFVVREASVEGDEPGPTQVAWKSGVKGDAGTVSVGMEPGQTIDVRVIVPPGVQGGRVWATDGVVRRDAWMPERTRGRVMGLHAGRWTVKASAAGPDGAFAAEAPADAGGSVELDLKPVR